MIAVDVRNLSKAYRLYRSPSLRLKEIIFRKSYHTDFLALRDISFSVPYGETFGIIGENGAGKSTLLKILAKTLKPTSGTVAIQGRTAALLELGAGFNPELTGEENIYLNAFLMGLSKEEIDEKKDEVVRFSELGEFIGQPVKTYSSGMYVRLAFSIATSVNPDVLIVDEALSVGDEYFQKKCIDRMMTFREAGKTILFCSHSMYHVQELCTKAMWLHNGTVRNIGDTGKVIMDYQNYERGRTAALKEKPDEMTESGNSSGKGPLRIVDVRVLDSNGSETESLRTFDPVRLSFRVRSGHEDLKGHIGFAITRNDEEMAFGTMTHFDGYSPISFHDNQTFEIRISSLPALAGLYHFVIVVADEHAVHPYDMIKTRNFPVVHGGKEFGMTYMEHEWIVS